VVLLDIGHEVLDLVLFCLADDELVGFLHVVVELLGEVGVSEEGVVHLDVEIVVVLVLLVGSERFAEGLVGLQVLALQLLQPLLGLLDRHRLHTHH
jgi:hypothetical protein